MREQPMHAITSGTGNRQRQASVTQIQGARAVVDPMMLYASPAFASANPDVVRAIVKMIFSASLPPFSGRLPADPGRLGIVIGCAPELISANWAVLTSGWGVLEGDLIHPSLIDQCVAMEVGLRATDSRRKGAVARDQIVLHAAGHREAQNPVGPHQLTGDLFQSEEAVAVLQPDPRLRVTPEDAAVMARAMVGAANALPLPVKATSIAPIDPVIPIADFPDPLLPDAPKEKRRLRAVQVPADIVEMLCGGALDCSEAMARNGWETPQAQKELAEKFFRIWFEKKLLGKDWKATFTNFMLREYDAIQESIKRQETSQRLGGIRGVPAATGEFHGVRMGSIMAGNLAMAQQVLSNRMQRKSAEGPA